MPQLPLYSCPCLQQALVCVYTGLGMGKAKLGMQNIRTCTAKHDLAWLAGCCSSVRVYPGHD